MNDQPLQPQDRRGLAWLLRSPSLYGIVGILLLAGFLCHWLGTHDPTSFQQIFGSAAIPISLVVHVIIAMTPFFPADVIAIANGAVYGFALGFILSCSGWWFAALMQFGLGRRVRKDFDLGNHTDHVPEWMQRLPIEHPLYLIGVRQVPWLGMHIGLFVPGAAGVAWKRFVWCSAIGVIPGSLLMTAIGAGIVHYQLS